jgi:hypothetical protein
MQSRNPQQAITKHDEALNLDNEVIIDTNVTRDLKYFIERVMPQKSMLLIDKIKSFFEIVSSAAESQLIHQNPSDQSLKYLLGRAYIADKQFYRHLQSIILKLDQVQYLPEQYSYNPYYGKEALLIKACSYLFDIIVKYEVIHSDGASSSKGIKDLKRWTKIKYQNVCETDIIGVIHPIFALVKAKLWDQITAWVREDPSILLMLENNLETKQPNNNLPFITSILIYNLEDAKDRKSLVKLQKFAISEYLSSEIYKNLPFEHEVYEPQIGLFLGLQLNNTMYTHYGELIGYFSRCDDKLKKNYFFQARINSKLLPATETQGMIGFLTLITWSPTLLPLPIQYSDSQVDILPKDEPILKYSDSQFDILRKDRLITELYSGFILDNKVNQQATKILARISSLLKDYASHNGQLNQQTIVVHTDSLNQCKSLDQLKIGENNLIKRMLEDYLKLYFSNYEGTKVINKLYKTIITIVENNSFNATDFIIKNSEVFEMICNIESEKLLNILKNRILETLTTDMKIKLDNVYYIKLLESLVPNAITAMWRGHKNNSDQRAAKHYIEVTVILNNIMQEIGNYIAEPAISLHSIDENTLFYLKCDLQNNLNIDTIADLDLQFQDGKFNLNGKGFPADYVRLYNFYSSFLMQKLYLQEVYEYEVLFKNSSLPQIATTQRNLFSWMIDQAKSYKDRDKQKINECNIAKGINLSLLYLSNSKNQFKIYPKKDNSHLTQLYFLFNSLERNHPIVQQITNATSELWQNIYMIGSDNRMQLLDFFHQPDNAKTRPYLAEADITYIIPRCMKAALMAEDFHGFKKWINYSLNLLSNKTPHNEVIRLNVKGVSNPEQLTIIHDALLIATMLNLPYGVEIILSDYKNFLLTYQDRKHFSKHTIYPFDVINTLRKSKMMEIAEFKESLSKITVMLLSYGYPIELIEKLDDLNVIPFIQSLMNEQVQYSAKRLALNYSMSLPIPFINHQFKDIAGKVAGSILESKYYLDIYEKSFKFFYATSENHQIDISKYCYVFSSILQPPDFLDRLKNITFLTGLKIDFNGGDHSEILIKQAKNINLIIQKMDNKIRVIKRNEFNTKWQSLMGDKVINLLANSEYSENNLYKLDIKEHNLEYESINFFQYLYVKSQKKDHPELALDRMKKENSIRVVAQVKAAITTGAFICLNNTEVRNALLTVIPAAYSGLTLAGSLSSSVLNAVKVTASSTAKSLLGSTGLYLILFGTAIGGLYLYQKQDNAKVLQVNSKTFNHYDDYYDKYQDKFDQTITLEKKIKVYKLMVKLFKKTSNGLDLMPQEDFFCRMQRFGLTPYDIDNAIDILRNQQNNIDDVNNALLTVAYVMTFAVMYLNIPKIKPLIDKVSDNDKQKFKEFLYKVLMGKIINIKFIMDDMNLQKYYSKDLDALSQEKVMFIVDNYEPEQSNQYSNLWRNTLDSNLNEKALQKIDMLENINPFIKFILILSHEIPHYNEVENEIIISENTILR